jgi:RNA polymerase primary sigma factor
MNDKDISMSTDFLALYLRDIRDASLLTPAEEISLAKTIRKGIAAEKTLKNAVPAAKGGRSKAKPSAPRIAKARRVLLEQAVREGKAAREKMIQANLRLVIKIAQDHANYGLPLLDLISEGNVGLTKAVDRFDPSKGAKLSTYAAWWIMQSIRRALSNQGKTIRVPIHLTDKIAKMRRITAQLTEELGREPSDEELGGELDISANKIARLRLASMQQSSLNTLVGEDGSCELGDLVPDDRAHNPSDLVERHELTQRSLQLLKLLDDRERTILMMRYGLDGQPAMTLEEVGEKFKVTRERIRQLQNIGLQKLNAALEMSPEETASGLPAVLKA